MGGAGPDGPTGRSPGDPPELEMLSGPDLGAGFLFQLTRDRADGGARYRFHAQDGGVDANGPPMGSPEPFGWHLSATMCPIGGRRCWEREFWPSEADSSRVRTSYNRTRFVMEASLEQVGGRRAVPVAAALAELLGSAPVGAAGPGPSWSVGGAAALWLRGAPVAPTSIEIETTEPVVQDWTGALEMYLIEPPATTRWYDRSRRFGARAFLGTLRDGTRVEWTVRPVPGGPRRADHRALDWQGHAMACHLPEEVLIDAASEGRADLLEAAARAVGSAPGSPERLEQLLGSSELPVELQERLRRRVAGPPGG